MKATTVRGLLVSPLFLYVAFAAGRRVAAPTLPFVIGAIAAAAPVLLPVWPGRAIIFVGPVLGVLGVLGVGALAGVAVSDPTWAGLMTGVLLTGPLGIIGVLWSARDSLAGSLLGSQVGLAVALLVHAVTVVVGHVGAAGPSAWGMALADIVRAQGGGIGAWAGGAGPSPLPLGAIDDPIIVGLTLLLALGVLVGFLDPVLRAAGAEPASGSLSVEPVVDLGRSSSHRPTAAPERGAREEPAEFPWPTAVVPLSVAIAAGFLWESAVSFVPRYALLGLAVATGAVLGALILTARAHTVRRGAPGPS